MNGLARVSAQTAIAAILLGAAALPVCAQTAQTAPAPVLPVESLFADASAKETAVRKALSTDEPLPTLLKAVRTVVADYEGVVRHYPASSFCDDALWRAAKLSRDAFEEFQDARERSAALRLYQLLTSRYPASKFAKQTAEPIVWLNAHPARSTSTAAANPQPAETRLPEALAARTATSVVPGPAPAQTGITSAPRNGASPTPRLVTIKAIRRAVLADVVRVVIELDSEVAFHDERIDSPSRVFVDLPSTHAVASLVDQTLRFDADTDVVRQIRIGRHPNSTTRVVIEAAGVSSYSVYPLYSPFRLVIDCLRSTPAVAAATPKKAPAAPPVVAPPLQARSVSWLTALPTGAPVALPGVAPAAVPEVTPTILPARPTSAPATLPSVPPSPNMNGGLSMARQLGLGVSRIVIDPGHGGHDPGAKGPGGTEADLVLDVALRLERLLGKLPGVEVVLTRRGNEFIPLQERTAIANREGADLFLSIHANASTVPAARGVETYFLNFASNQTAAAVAARENATSDQSMGALQDVVKAITLNSKLDESRDFATYVHREMLGSLKAANKTVKDLGVKQAPFVVLIGAAMPSVLAEISFITNPQEARLLGSTGYRQRIAQALFEGIRRYQVSLKRASAVAQQQN